MNRTYTLQPTNEGQSLNYVEQVKGSKAFIIGRAKQIVVGLNRLMPEGTFGCGIEELREGRASLGSFRLFINHNLEEIKEGLR
jgi:hypothetical protein